MPRPYLGPKLWLDPNRGTWTIIDGAKRIRTGFVRNQQGQAMMAIAKYSDGVFPAERPKGPKPAKRPRRGVYALGFGPYIKIGITTDIDARMASLQTPEPVKLYGLIIGWRAEEIELHKRFAEYRLQGEWFLKKGALSDWIDGGCK